MSCEIFFEKWSKNPMTKPKIEKVTVNICTGRSGEPLEKASRILEQLTAQKPVFRLARKTVKDFGIRRGEPIAAVVTLRKQKAAEFLTKAFSAVGNKIAASAFDAAGNFAFGIKEHIEIPGVRYDPELGVVGMNICATIGRQGYRVKTKKRARSHIGPRHRVTPEEAMCFIKNTYGVEIMEGESV